MKFLAIHDVDGYSEHTYALEEMQHFDTLDEAFAWVANNAEFNGNSETDYTIYVAHPVKRALSI